MLSQLAEQVPMHRPAGTRMVVAAALAAVLGGTLGIAARGTASPAAAATTFAAPVVVYTGAASEPGVLTGPGGVLYIDAPDGLDPTRVPTSASLLFRSTNGGASWALTPAGMRAELPGGGDVSVAAYPSTGALAMVDLWLGASTASVSTNGGNSWTAQC